MNGTTLFPDEKKRELTEEHPVPREKKGQRRGRQRRQGAVPARRERKRDDRPRGTRRPDEPSGGGGRYGSGLDPLPRTSPVGERSTGRLERRCRCDTHGERSRSGAGRDNFSSLRSPWADGGRPVGGPRARVRTEILGRHEAGSVHWEGRR